MDRIRLGKTGLMVSQLGFGGIPIQRCTEEGAIEVVRKCLDAGITFIDTAAAYTTSEAHIGKAIAGRRQGLVIATKTNERTREGVERQLEQSLKNLGVSSIDLYQFHGVGDAQSLRAVLDPNGPMATVREAYRAGLVKHIGITSHAIDIAKEAVKTGLFETIMFPFNFITCEPALELLPLVRERDMGFIAMKPLNGGMISAISISFKYLMGYPDVLPLVGIEKPAEIDEIVRLYGHPHKMTRTEELEMERLKQEMGQRFCRRCDYCQPCEQGIRMSSVFFMRSMAKRSQPGALYNQRAADVMAKVSGCIECGDCEKRCPYDLPIRQMLKEEMAWYEAARREWLETMPAKA